MVKKVGKKKTGLKRGQYHVKLTAPDGTSIILTAESEDEADEVMEIAVHWTGIEVIDIIDHRGRSIRSWDWKDQPEHKRGKKS